MEEVKVGEKVEERPKEEQEETSFEMLKAKMKMGATDCVSGFPPFGHLFYNGLAGPRYLLEKNI